MLACFGQMKAEDKRHSLVLLYLRSTSGYQTAHLFFPDFTSLFNHLERWPAMWLAKFPASAAANPKMGAGGFG